MRGEHLQPRLLYLARTSFKIDGEIKSFSDKQKLREFSTNNQLYNKCSKDLYSQGTQEKKKDLQDQPQTVKKMAIGTYISIITLNVNGLNAPTKRHRWRNGYKNKTHIQAVYKKPTSDLRTHIDWKWENGKIHSMQMGSKRKLE